MSLQKLAKACKSGTFVERMTSRWRQHGHVTWPHAGVLAGDVSADISALSGASAGDKTQSLFCAAMRGSGFERSYACSQLEFMRPLTVAILSERRAVAPFGIAGGGSAQKGLNLVLRKDGHTVNIGAKSVVELQAGAARPYPDGFFIAI